MMHIILMIVARHMENPTGKSNALEYDHRTLTLLRAFISARVRQMATEIKLELSIKMRKPRIRGRRNPRGLFVKKNTIRHVPLVDISRVIKT
jgi:hypothetical protein